MNKDQLKGRVEESKGKVKEVVGKLFGDNEMKAEGNVQINTGKLQAVFGDIKHTIKNNLDD
ncbi:CsbD family protein [Methylomonas sp. AM2-LC]|uniref:CsbD family protein n=1 Tax=Methylomonas sp. AM2-LC TaxID=3153301 RepID=UPI003263A670